MSARTNHRANDTGVLRGALSIFRDARQPLLLRPPSPGPRDGPRLPARKSSNPPPASTISTAASPGTTSSRCGARAVRHSLAGGAGRSGLDYLSYITVIHELAKVDASHAITVSAHTTLGTSPIMDFGTDEQKRRFVPFLAAGKVLGGFGLTERRGSDAGGTKTTAVDRGTTTCSNGSKIFITHAGVEKSSASRRAPTRTPSAPTGSPPSSSRRTPAISTRRSGSGSATRQSCEEPRRALRKKEDKLGWRASDTRELIFQDAVVRRRMSSAGEQRVRQFLHTGWTVAGSGSRPVARPGGGRAGGVPDVYLHRKQFGRPIASSRACISPSPTWRPRSKPPSSSSITPPGSSSTAISSRRKRHGEALCLRVCMRATTKAVQLAWGLRLHDGVPGRTDDAGRQICEIGERGTSEIQRCVSPAVAGGLMIDLNPARLRFTSCIGLWRLSGRFPIDSSTARAVRNWAGELDYCWETTAPGGAAAPAGAEGHCFEARILISGSPRETRVAILEDTRLLSLLSIVPTPTSVGDIYVGKVEAVLPGIQAAFVDIGPKRAPSSTPPI